MFKVGSKVFDSFEEVVSYAWDTYMIDIAEDRRQLVDEAEQRQACEELEIMLTIAGETI